MAAQGQPMKMVSSLLLHNSASCELFLCMGGFSAQLTNRLASLTPSPALLNQHQFA
jgi:hypothetical protein